MFVARTAQAVWQWFLTGQEWLWGNFGVPWAWLGGLLNWAGDQTVTIQVFCLVVYLAAGAWMAMKAEKESRFGRVFLAVGWGPLIVITLTFGIEMIGVIMFYSLWVFGAVMMLVFLMFGWPTEFVLRWMCSFFGR